MKMQNRETISLCHFGALYHRHITQRVRHHQYNVFRKLTMALRTRASGSPSPAIEVPGTTVSGLAIKLSNSFPFHLPLPAANRFISSV